MATSQLYPSAQRDLELVTKYRSGDHEAAEELFAAYKPLVINRAKKYFLQGGEQEDLIQEGMIGLFQALEIYDITSALPFASLAEQLVQARLIDAVRSGTRQKYKPLNESISLEAKAENPANADFYSEKLNLLVEINPEDKAIAKEELEALHAFMQNKLSNLESEVVSLLQQGMSYREAGDILNKNEKSIDNAVQRIRRKMKHFRADQK